MFIKIIPVSDFMTGASLPHLTKVTGIILIAISVNHPSKNGLPKKYIKLFFFEDNGAKRMKLKVFIKVEVDIQ